ncbi:hypothetical protein L249_6353 [Ophiocordyceps polyrhachis-furcata BCC 54312]|uniref:Uncharacterized protein n=1 Tax=Ophiocordyceps polyrhachis-furcata BCC 54312 TaxID=1330021 RepID=A0A367L0Z9_9HYPO|nr:hypothetical protein L249_6353 [Ophiocordyceps polyrhachis-furcata BCC 54312]
MSRPKQPKVLLFDIGGVCVISPFQAILDYELTLGIPPGWVNYSISKASPNGFWHRLERGEIPLDAAFFDGFNRDLHDPALWKKFYEREQLKNDNLAQTLLPPLPALDGEWLFNKMMHTSQEPDPWMSPALKSLRESDSYILGALSNTMIFPPGHALYHADYFKHPLRQSFDVFISSAHVGLRKPDPAVYKLAVATLDQYAKDNAASERGSRCGWQVGVRADDILFLDDIGENLKVAAAQGFRTIKVPLGKSYEAVEELEHVTGLKLQGHHPKSHSSTTTKAKI